MTMPYGPPQGQPWMPPPRPRRWTWRGVLLGSISFLVLALLLTAFMLFGWWSDRRDQQQRAPGTSSTTQ